MKIAIAPYLPIIINSNTRDPEFISLCLDKLPDFVSLVICGKWNDILNTNIAICSSHELSWLLRKINVIEVSPDKRAAHIRISPDILAYIDPNTLRDAKQQIFALFNLGDTKRIYAGSPHQSDNFQISYNKVSVPAINFYPTGGISIIDIIQSYTPKLEQLKHYHQARQNGDKSVAPFSAYEKNDETYAKLLLQRAYIEHPGDVNDRTYLYTYDHKYKTYVEFRPDRNKIYHGMNIDVKKVLTKAPEIVKKYHKK